MIEIAFTAMLAAQLCPSNCAPGLPAAAAEPPITAVAFTPDGHSIVAASQSGLTVFGWPQLERQRRIKPSALNLHSLAFSPDGKHLAVGGGHPSELGSVEIFAWPAAELVGAFDDHDDSVRSVAWTNNSRLLSASIDRQIKLWDLANNKAAVLAYKGHSRSVTALCLLRDGKTLVSAGVDQSLRVWGLESAELHRTLNQHTQTVHSLALRPVDGGLPMVASAAGDHTIRFWQPTIGRMVRYVRLESEPLNIAWLRDGSRIVACCVDGHIRMVDANEVKVTANLPVIDGWAYAIGVHPNDGSVAVAGSGGQIRRMVLQTSDLEGPESSLPKPELAHLKSGYSVAGLRTSALSGFNLGFDHRRHRWRAHRSPSSPNLKPDGVLVRPAATSAAGTARAMKVSVASRVNHDGRTLLGPVLFRFTVDRFINGFFPFPAARAFLFGLPLLLQLSRPLLDRVSVSRHNEPSPSI